MATHWLDLETDFWDFLNGEATYTALGLTEYRTNDGNLFPWDEGEIPGSAAKLPAIIVDVAANDVVDHTQNGLQDGLTLNVQIIHDATSGTVSRATSEADVAVVVDLLDAAANRRTNLGSDNIHEYSVGAPVPEPLSKRATLVGWRWTFQVTLEGRRRFIT